MADEHETPNDEGKGGEGTGNERTFSQADVDRIVQDRLARDRAKFADYDELKSKASKLDEIEQANASELEKAVARAEKAEQAMAEAQSKAREIALRSSIIAEAAKPERKVADPEAAFAFLTGLDKELLVVDDAGAPTNIAEAMDALLERRSYLAASGGPKPRTDVDQGARSGDSAQQISADALQNMSPEDIVKARREGRLNDVMAGS